MRAFLASLLFVVGLGPLAAAGECVGRNLVDEMPADARAELRAATDKVPFAQGNLWQATKGDAVVTLVGTYHVDDPRHAGMMAAVGPYLRDAKLLLVEAGPEETAALKSRIAAEPELMVNTSGPTLPEVLSPELWDKLSVAMQRRGVPAFMVAKFQPWYVSMLLSVPPCAMTAMGEGKGLDASLIDAAKAQGLPIRALEPYDTVFHIFGDLPEEEKLSMVTSALALDDQSEDVSITMADLYFREDARMIWEFMREESLKLPGYTPERVAEEFATMEAAMMTRRNQSWIAGIEAAAQEGPVLAAFGALHLSGEAGVLRLLEKAGFKIERLAL